MGDCKLDKPFSAEQIAEKYVIAVEKAEGLLVAGTQIELEHTHSESVARTIASHHIYKENSGYYKKLKQMEDKFTEGGNVHDCKGGCFAKGKSHAEGGIKAIVEGGSQRQVEIEGNEAVIVPEAVNDPVVHTYTGTNRDVLSKINQSGGGKSLMSDGKEKEVITIKGGSVIITKNAVLDTKTYTYTGTHKEILNQINQGGGGVPIHKTGGELMGNYGGLDAGLNKKPLTEFGSVKVYTINGDHYRKTNIEFTMGGHKSVGDAYGDIPENEIWIDDNLAEKKDDLKATVLHELTEYRLMNEKGMSYNKAHQICERVESDYRKTNKDLSWDAIGKIAENEINKNEIKNTDNMENPKAPEEVAKSDVDKKEAELKIQNCNMYVDDFKKANPFLPILEVGGYMNIDKVVHYVKALNPEKVELEIDRGRFNKNDFISYSYDELIQMFENDRLVFPSYANYPDHKDLKLFTDMVNMVKYCATAKKLEADLNAHEEELERCKKEIEDLRIAKEKADVIEKELNEIKEKERIEKERLDADAKAKEEERIKNEKEVADRLALEQIEKEYIDSRREELKKKIAAFKNLVALADEKDKDFLNKKIRVFESLMAMETEKMCSGGSMFARGGSTESILTEYRNYINKYYADSIKHFKDDKDMVKMFKKDIADHEYIIEEMGYGNYESAYKHWGNMDTAARDVITGRAYDLLKEKNEPAFAKGGGVGKSKQYYLHIKPDENGEYGDAVYRGSITDHSGKEIYKIHEEDIHNLTGQNALKFEPSKDLDAFEDYFKDAAILPQDAVLNLGEEYGGGGGVDDNLEIKTEENGVFVVEYKGSKYWSMPDESKEDFLKRVKEQIRFDFKSEVNLKTAETIEETEEELFKRETEYARKRVKLGQDWQSAREEFKQKEKQKKTTNKEYKHGGNVFVGGYEIKPVMDCSKGDGCGMTYDIYSGDNKVAEGFSSPREAKHYLKEKGLYAGGGEIKAEYFIDPTPEQIEYAEKEGLMAVENDVLTASGLVAKMYEWDEAEHGVEPYIYNLTKKDLEKLGKSMPKDIRRSEYSRGGNIPKGIKSLKLPSGFNHNNDGTGSWNKTGGYAGAHTIGRVKEEALRNGWVAGKSESSTSPSDLVSNTDKFVSPDGQYTIEFYVRWGYSSGDNSFGITINKKEEKKEKESESYEKRFDTFINKLQKLTDVTGIAIMGAGSVYDSEGEIIKYSDDYSSGDIMPDGWKTKKDKDAPENYYKFVDGLELITKETGVAVQIVGGVLYEVKGKYVNDWTSGDIDFREEEEKEEFDKGGEVKIGDIIRHKRTGAEFVVDKIEGNTIKGVITKTGTTDVEYVKVGNRNKTSKNLIGITYEIVVSNKASSDKEKNEERIFEIQDELEAALDYTYKKITQKEDGDDTVYLYRGREVGRWHNDLFIGEFTDQYSGGGKVSKRVSKTRLKKLCPVGTKPQSVIIYKKYFTKPEAKYWCKKHGFKSVVDTKERTYRFRQANPNKFDKNSLRTKRITQGVKMVVGCPKNK